MSGHAGDPRPTKADGLDVDAVVESAGEAVRLAWEAHPDTPSAAFTTDV